MVSLNSHDFNCFNCDKYKRKDRGCTEDAPIPRRWKVGKDNYQRCPVKLVTAFTCHCLELYGHYKNNFLLQSGGIIDQQAKYLRIMRFIQSEISRQKEEN